MDWVMTNMEGIVQVATAVIAAAAAITALTPSPKDDGVLAKLRGLLDLLALNVSNAQNKE